jgi:cytochrome c-type biogenesis protein CcmH
MRLSRSMAAGIVAAGLAFGGPAGAVEPGEILPDAGLEARARSLSAELRCLVCQNQSIDDSNAPLAKDLRLIVRERLTAGDSDAAIRAFVVDRYGSFVLLRPPVTRSTALLWSTPPLLLALCGWLFWRRRRRASLAPEAIEPLTADEVARLERLTKL